MKPIRFNTFGVKAILDNRKTQTRRLIKGFIPKDASFGYTLFTPVGSISCRGMFNKGYGEKFFKIPYQVGDILYVQETWMNYTPFNPFGKELPSYVIFRADCSRLDELITRPKWRSSTTMPKEAARIFLKVTAVRVERLQDIMEEDAKAEGFNSREEFLQEIIKIYPDSTVDNWCWVYTFERCENPEVQK